MTTRAKVRVESVKLIGGDGKQHTAEEVQMRAVPKSGAYPESGLDEDNTYAKFSPSADFRLLIANPALFGEFKPEQRRYVDISDPIP
jgi:hypothetical protein